MTRNLKVLGLALVAVLAMSALAASTASAQKPFHFTGPSGTATVTGSQIGTDVFTTDAGKVSCLEATYTGTVTGPTTTTVTATPTYSQCHIIVLFTFSVTIHMNGCNYRFKAVTKTASGFHGTVDIVCPANQKIVITAPGCTVTVPPQNNLSSVTFTHGGAGTTTDLVVDANLSGITYEGHSSGTCGSINTVLKHNGTYVGQTTASGENAAGHQAIGVKET